MFLDYCLVVFNNIPQSLDALSQRLEHAGLERVHNVFQISYKEKEKSYDQIPLEIQV